MIRIELPYPPTVNKYYIRSRSGKVVMNDKARSYRMKAMRVIMLDFQERWTDPLEVKIVLHPPDNGKHDVDNVLKALLDALQHGGAYEDDSQIQRLSIWKGEPKPPNGCALVEIERL